MDCWAPRYVFTASTLLHVCKYTQVPPVEKAPVLMLRPRAWNMTEHNVLLGTMFMPALTPPSLAQADFTQ